MRASRSVWCVLLLWAILGCSGGEGPDTMDAPASDVAASPSAGPDGTSVPPTPNASVVLPPGIPEPNPDDPVPGTSAAPASPEQAVAALPARSAVVERCAERGDTVGTSRLRRITREAYANSVSDLLGVQLSTARSIEPDESIGPFYSNAIAPVTDLIVEQYQSTAAEAARAALARRDELAGCDLGEDTCRSTFIASFGQRVYRRPLDSTEIESYRQLFALAPDPDAGLSAVVETMLQSPYFLYHHELGAQSAPSDLPVPATAHELASRLSYFLWSTLPDAELFTTADDGTLMERATLTRQVERLLADPRAARAIQGFHQGWLGLRGLEGVEKDPVAFPSFTPELQRAMLNESMRFADHVVRFGDGSLASLLSADYSFLEGPLFELYGVDRPMGHDTSTPVRLDPAQRAGILTQAAFLAAHAHRDQTSPVHRGILVRENLLCHIIPSPPADVNNVAPSVNSATTTRQRFAQHVADPTCATCHTLIDPIGLGFENYDPIGAYRSHEGDVPIDASGAITAAGSDVEGAFVGGVELAQRLARSEQVRLCVSNQWFRFALGRMESQDDACTLETLYTAMDTTDGNLRSLIASIAGSTAFTHVRTGAP